MEWENKNIVVNLFEDGAVDIQTYIDIDEVNENEELSLRDIFYINDDGKQFHRFPFWD